MFIERLEKIDLLDFYNDETKLEDIYKFERTKGGLLFSNGKTMTHRVTDFDCMIGPNIATNNKGWRIFMYAKFGENYKEAFKQYLEEQAKLKIDKEISIFER